MTGEAHLLDPANAPGTQRRYHSSVMQRVKTVTSHAAAYVQRWRCGTDVDGHHDYVPGSGSYAPVESEPARMSGRMLIAVGRGPARVPTCEQALRDGQTKFYHVITTGNEDWFLSSSLRYDLRFDEWQDDYDAKTRALRKILYRTARVDDLSPVLARALSLFGPGELRALRVLDIDVFRLATSLMSTSTGSGPAPQLEQAMNAISTVHVRGSSFSPSPVIGSLAAVLQRHSSTITEFDAELPVQMLDEASSALACCTQLESLSRARLYNSAVWLGLSNLHTVLGVNLGEVSFAAIAAALPRLHTLGAFGGNDPAQAEFFMTGLLPRLRVFHFNGAWPKTQERPASTVAPLPLLQELVWNLSDDTTAPPEFLGARPIVLHAPFALISQCWLAAADAPANFLARVRNVRITTMFRLDRLDQLTWRGCCALRRS